mmetsp:Transcript_110529/g.246986  ORF Transcript_110529/g.246986 Transcript_110529/m.246986 type:complete len:162 (+) Transcript_110529:89-574(+)
MSCIVAVFMFSSLLAVHAAREGASGDLSGAATLDLEKEEDSKPESDVCNPTFSVMDRSERYRDKEFTFNYVADEWLRKSLKAKICEDGVYSEAVVRGKKIILSCGSYAGRRLYRDVMDLGEIRRKLDLLESTMKFAKAWGHRQTPVIRRGKGRFYKQGCGR